MLTNIIQKPLGALAILTAAIGGPYAAFETETGTSIRKSIFGRNGATSASENPQGFSSNDSYALTALNGNGGGTWPSHNAAPASQPFPSTFAQGGAPSLGPNYSMSGQTTGQPIGAPAGHPISVTYGQPIVQPLGQSYSVGNNNPIETRQGPSNLVPGNTNQLWDYTLGVPSLQQIQQQPAPLGGGEVHDLREVLRFDIHPNWLPQRFARVSTVLSNVQMDGLRVPLITGTRPTDIAGTLTYYFDSSQSLRRINLHGLTGDSTQLSALMVQFYGLKPEQSLGGQLFTTRWNNRIANLLSVSPAPVIYAGADHSKYIVFLELNQATSNFGLSQEASDLLQNAQATRRW